MSETPVLGGTEEVAGHASEDGTNGHESEAEPQCPQTPSGSRLPQTSPGLDHYRDCDRGSTQVPTNFEGGQEEADMEQHTMARTARIQSARPAHQEDVRRCINRIKNDIPTVALDDDTLLRLLQTRVPGSVTNDKEVMGMVQAEWETSRECLAMRIAPDIRTETRDAWRISVHLLRCSPIAIISPAWGLYYDNDNRETCLWSRKFSSTLGMIMIHPIWNEDKHSLIRAIQVAVTCRTEEHRPFRMPGGESAIVNCLAREVAHNTNGRSMAEICNSLRRAHGTARTRMTTTTEFAFIKHLAATVSVSSQDLSDALGDDVRLRVQEQDLENIVKAINTFTPFGPPCTPPAAIYQGYLASHDSQPDLGVARIRELYTQSWLIELREKWRHEQEPGHRQSQVLDEPRLIQHGQGHPRPQSGQDSVALSRPTYQALTLPSSRRTAPAANNSQPPKPPSGSILRSEGQRIDDIENDAATDDDLLGRAKAKQAVIMSLRRRPIFPLQIDLSFEVLMCSSLMMDVRDGDRFRLRGDQIKYMHDDSWVMGPPNYDLTRLKYNVTDVMTAMLATQIRAVDGFPQLTLLGVMLDEFESTDHADCRSYAFNNRPNIVMIRLRADPKHKFRLWDVMSL
ncbi:hypothetical protein VFPFJ_09242 [Purpureocillium lilacinum]|uniref:Uncharacterized protein n=1 Tax=Purpureocillium lilacinum TaxID=33203 RepID=A0A179GTJ7_PURLI|nr:hypothetical protein VFPFJ_09242 [Purpureocillium lilacinum]OAQ80788.1 hypothetical protein VFPFJ_09242 [Purpureocillium lilacinum]